MCGLFSETSDHSGAGSGIEKQSSNVDGPSETFQLVHEAEIGEEKNEDDYKPNHSRTFRQQLNGSDVQQASTLSAPNAPPKFVNRATLASKPEVWSPRNLQGGVASSTIQSSPFKPTGVCAIRADKGEATTFKADDMLPRGRIPVCYLCQEIIRGPYVYALDKTWCSFHFVCVYCRVDLLHKKLVLEAGNLYCVKDYETHLAPHCAVCGNAILEVGIKTLINLIYGISLIISC
ncbi:LDB3 [Mytilus coruscus]|uniref:LDB3 n=1 Tax=Mytilus coruscus TaxID=42192 RepID=A0A6J8EZT1_MYTCO|nr:LDB3 [Mytilus coruscus]